MKTALKMSGVALLLCLAVGIWLLREREIVSTYSGASLAGPGDNLSPAQRQKRWRSQVDDAVKHACSNEPGFHRLVNYSADTFDGNPAKWTARAEIEVITGAIGIERRILKFRGGSMNGNLYFDSGRINPTADLWHDYSNRIIEINARYGTNLIR